MLNSLKGRATAGAIAAATLAVALGFGLAQGQDEPARTESHSARTEKIKIGTFEHDRVVQSFYKTRELILRAEDIQRRAMAAQEAQDQQALTQLQMEWQQLPMLEQEVIQLFNAEVDRVAPEIAAERGLVAVAPELVYAGDNVEPEDISDAVIEAINEGHEVPELPAPEMPNEGEGDVGDETDTGGGDGATNTDE